MEMLSSTNYRVPHRNKNMSNITLSQEKWPTVLPHLNYLVNYLNVEDGASSTNGAFGCDLEYSIDTHEPYQASIALESGVTASGPWDSLAENMIRQLLSKGMKIVGHNVGEADCPIIERKLRIPEIPLEQIEDTYLMLYLAHQDFCKGTKEVDSEGGFEYKRGAGLLSLRHLLVMYSKVPAFYKKCRGSACVGPCPTHMPVEYNGIDAYAPLEALPRIKAALKKRNIPKSLYRHIGTPRY